MIFVNDYNLRSQGIIFEITLELGRKENFYLETWLLNRILLLLRFHVRHLVEMQNINVGELEVDEFERTIQ